MMAPRDVPNRTNADPTPKIRRQIAVGDIHGRFDLLRVLLEEKIVFDERTDELVFLGDYIDRGPQSREVLTYLNDLRKNRADRLTFLKGNHEAMARAALDTGDEQAMDLWLINGGNATLKSFGGLEAARLALLPFIDSLSLFRETAEHLFVHAGILPDRSLPSTPEDVLLWSRQFLPHDSGKTVVVGHSIHDAVTFFGGVIALDTGACYTGLLSAYDVLNNRIYDTA